VTCDAGKQRVCDNDNKAPSYCSDDSTPNDGKCNDGSYTECAVKGAKVVCYTPPAVVVTCDAGKQRVCDNDNKAPTYCRDSSTPNDGKCNDGSYAECSYKDAKIVCYTPTKTTTVTCDAGYKRVCDHDDKAPTYCSDDSTPTDGKCDDGSSTECVKKGSK